MTDNILNPIIELVSFKGEDCLKFTFTGYFSAKYAEFAVAEWREYFETLGNDKVVVIWDSVNMTGFDLKAQKIWQKELKELKGQIKCVWLITNSKIIRVGAKLMSVFTNYCLKVVDTPDNITFSILL